MNIGFDPGSYELRTVWCRGHNLIARRYRSAYAILPDEPSNRQLLVDSRQPFARCDRHLLLLGETIDSLGAELDCPQWSLMPGGKLDDNDPLARSILIAELESLIPPSPTPESLCGISLPCESVNRNADLFQSTQDLLLHWIRGRGYTPAKISPGQALILAELSEQEFSGIAVTFGSAFCTYSLCQQGRELLCGFVARGGQWIDEQLAGQLIRQQFEFAAFETREPDTFSSLQVPDDLETALLRDLYSELLSDVFQQIVEDLAETALPRSLRPQTLIVSGGLTGISEFRGCLADVLRRIALPIEIAGLRIAEDSVYTIARGCLIHASLTKDSKNDTKHVA